MRVFSFFENEGRLEAVEVELELLKGLPNLQVIGLPDTHIRESALRIKSALTAQGYQWPKGQQVVVNLRPSHLRKQSRGLELAIAVALVWATGQAECVWALNETEVFIYGELGLNGDVRCPENLETTPAADCVLLLGKKKTEVEGRFYEISKLADLREPLIFRENMKKKSWFRPEPPAISFSEPVARLLKLVALSEASSLLAGPPGTGKSTWAQALHCLLNEPPPDIWESARSLHAREGRRLDWRPLVNPHHTIPAISMIGGGYPLFPGEIAKAHGGVLLLDELLEFDRRVIDALREPIEAGAMRVSRRGHTRIWPTQFQLVATTNLCPCGKLSPSWTKGCALSLFKCRRVWERLSGPVLDRFDLLLFTQHWNSGSKTISVHDILLELEERRARSSEIPFTEIPELLVDKEMSMRRRRSMSRVAKGLALLDGAEKIHNRHWVEAHDLCVKPQEAFRQLFA